MMLRKFKYIALVVSVAFAQVLLWADTGISAWGNADAKYDDPNVRGRVWCDGTQFYVGNFPIPSYMSIEDAKKFCSARAKAFDQKISRIIKSQDAEISRLQRENAIADEEMNARVNEQIRQAQMSAWPRCQAMLGSNLPCGRYCFSRTSKYCYDHCDYTPLAEAFTGDKGGDIKASERIIAAAWKMLSREVDGQERTNAVLRIEQATEACRAACATRDADARRTASDMLWSVWHDERKAISTRARKRIEEWELAHPEEVAKRIAREEELRRIREEEVNLAKAFMTSNTFERIRQSLVKWQDEYGQFDLPDSLDKLRFMPENIMGFADGWGNDISYSVCGNSVVLKSAGSDGAFATTDDQVFRVTIATTDVKQVAASDGTSVEVLRSKSTSDLKKDIEALKLRMQSLQRSSALRQGRKKGVIVHEPVGRPISTTDPDQRKFSK